MDFQDNGRFDRKKTLNPVTTVILKLNEREFGRKFHGHLPRHNYIQVRPPQDFDVLAVLEFQIPCSRPETHDFYLRCLITENEDHG